MNKLLYILIIFEVFLSCKKDDLGTSTPGFLEEYINSDPNIKVEKTVESIIDYNEYAQTCRGYVFRPLKNIRITAIGGKIAATGTYKIEIYHLNNYPFLGDIDTTIIDSIKINNISKFQFKEITNNNVLLSNNLYLIRYHNSSHNSVYDARYFTFPLVINDIEIIIPYFTYEIYEGGFYYSEGTWDTIILRGLVDFKYELME